MKHEFVSLKGHLKHGWYGIAESRCIDAPCCLFPSSGSSGRSISSLELSCNPFGRWDPQEMLGFLLLSSQPHWFTLQYQSSLHMTDAECLIGSPKLSSSVLSPSDTETLQTVKQNYHMWSIKLHCQKHWPEQAQKNPSGKPPSPHSSIQHYLISKRLGVILQQSGFNFFLLGH